MLPDRLEDDRETTLIEIPVSEKIAGRQVHELELPHGVLITMNIHKGKGSDGRMELKVVST